MTAFLSLPGGGFYDNFGTRKSQQSIQTIRKGGVLLGDAASLHTQLQAWRAKVGKRGRLTATWDDGSLRWKWARLQDVSAPRATEAKGGWLPFDLTWVAASGGWRGPLLGSAPWVWGDGTWVFGDGTAAFGSSGAYSWVWPSLNSAISTIYNGDIQTDYMVLRLLMTGSWTDVTIINQMTGQQIIVDRSSSGTEPWVEINTGARTIYAAGTAKTISSALRSRNVVTVTTSSAHGLVTGDSVRISGTGRYDGDYYPAVETSTTVFDVPLPADNPAYGTVTTGTAEELTSIYALTTFTDRSRWFSLIPGDNQIRIIWAPFPTTATFEVEYYAQYA